MKKSKKLLAVLLVCAVVAVGGFSAFAEETAQFLNPSPLLLEGLYLQL